MVISFPANVCAVFEILVMLFQVCGIMGLCLESTRAAIDALVVARTDRFHHRPLRPWDRRAPCAAATIRNSPCSPAGP